ncbi:hypothetical protein Tco_0525840 [Tanacetum coccineum]
MSSDNTSSTVTYTFISSDSDGPSWGIPLMNAGELPEMDPYKEVTQQGQAAPLSHTYVPGPMELKHHILPYATDASPSALSPGYIAESDPEEDLKKDSEEDSIDYAADTDDDEEDEESSDDDEEEEEHLAPVVALSAIDHVPSAKETKPFETDESAATPPPPPPAYRTTSRMSVRTQTPIPFPSEEEVARLFALPTPPPSPLTLLSSPLPHIPSPPSHHPLPLPAPSTSRIADIPEAELPPRKRLLLTAPTPRFEIGESSTAAAARQPRSTMARRVDYGFVDTLDASIRASEQKAMAAVELVNLRVNYQASVHRRESEEFQTRHQDAQDDRAALRDEVDTLRRYLSSLCTTHEQERVEARQALDRSEAHIRALEARIAVLETQAYRHEWQRQDADDRATGHIMRIQALKAGALVDTLEDTGSGA